MATELAKAYVQIVPFAKGIKGQLEQTMGGEAESAGDQAGKKAGKSFASTFKKILVAAGVGKMVTDALKEGAALEQATGGIETLFKDSADAVIENAQRAYMTAGLSANEYMETATSFAASLLQGLGGDTQEAARITDMAIQDMSDNANKMGTDMASIQTAYQGFAKQNYTMLDNLKLGYGGTKGEMERLLADAEALSGVHYDIQNLNDVYSAIHVIQGELEITGTTSKEASETMTGSLNAMKAAAQNFLGYLATGQDVEPALTELVNSASTFLFNNLVPAIENIVKAVPGVIKVVIEEGIPMLIDNGMRLVEGIVEGIEENIDSLIEGALTLIVNLVKYLLQNVPKLIELGIRLTVAIIEGLTKALPDILASAGEIIKAIFKAFASVDWASVGKNLINGIIRGLANAAKALWEAVKNLAAQALNTIKGALGIASPSKAFRDVGEMIGLGLTQGIGRSESLVDRAMTELAGTTAAGFGIDLGVNPSIRSGAGSAVSDIVNGLTPFMGSAPVTLQVVLDSQVVAEAVYDPLQNVQIRRGIAYGY